MSRKVLSPMFALLIFVAHLNCVVEHQLMGETGSAGVTAKSGNLEVPAEGQVPLDSEVCDHGCICKGATLATSFVFGEVDVESFCFQLVSILPISCLCDRPELCSDRLPEIPVFGAPLRALDRCSLLQTFLI